MISGEWVGSVSSSLPMNQSEDANNAKNKSTAISALATDSSRSINNSQFEDVISANSNRITGDETMSREYISRLLPAFTSLFLQQAMQPNMRKAALTLVRKMAHFCPPDLMMSLASASVPQNQTRENSENSEKAKREDSARASSKSSQQQYKECSQLAVQLVQVIAAVLDNEVRIQDIFLHCS